MKFEERATMSTEITGPSGCINVSMRKQPETAATDHSHFTSAGSTSTVYPTVETINLTNTTAQIKETEDSLASVSVINNQKIEQIKQSLLEGSYQIDSKRIADKLIALEFALSK
jgi:negative regulator of flagellin synthesis FlgM